MEWNEMDGTQSQHLTIMQQSRAEAEADQAEQEQTQTDANEAANSGEAKQKAGRAEQSRADMTRRAKQNQNVSTNITEPQHN
jgi:hypothetical protein